MNTPAARAARDETVAYRRQVKLISAIRVEDLEQQLNAFLEEQGDHVVYVSDRILRNGNELLMNCLYELPIVEAADTDAGDDDRSSEVGGVDP